jgi:hypothetical protein
MADKTKLSRSKIALFMECPCCFYKAVKNNINRPPGFPFTLNSAVDTLLKREFDHYRVFKQVHPLVKAAGMNYVPGIFPELNDWRNSKKGISFHYEEYNFLLYGAIDDLWLNEEGELVVVDYKATAKKEVVTSLDADHHIHYKRQLEFYQWLFFKNGHKVDPTGVIVYCTGKTTEELFNNTLHFDISIIPYKGNYAWVEPVLKDIHTCLANDIAPVAAEECQYCNYVSASLQK